MRAQRYPGLYKSYGVAPLTAAQEGFAEEVIEANAARLKARLETQRALGHRQMILSEENLLGSMKINFKQASLYPDVAHRLAVISKIFGPYCQRISLTIRSYETYWPSLVAHLISKGEHLPSLENLAKLAGQPRRWRDVIVDICAGFPEADIRVMDFERWARRHEAQIEAIYGASLSLPTQPVMARNVSLGKAALFERLKDHGAYEVDPFGDGRGPYLPFSSTRIRQMRGAYAQDMAWLRQG